MWPRSQPAVTRFARYGIAAEDEPAPLPCAGTIEVEFANGSRMRITGAVDPATRAKRPHGQRSHVCFRRLRTNRHDRVICQMRDYHSQWPVFKISQLLGEGILRIHSRTGHRGNTRIHQEAGRGGQAPGADESVALISHLQVAHTIRGRVSGPDSRFERLITKAPGFAGGSTSGDTCRWFCAGAWTFTEIL
jgi:hypothetical protein